MVQVILPLKRAVTLAEKEPEVKDFKEKNKAFLASAHTILATGDSISSWGLNYFSDELNQAETFEVSQDVGKTIISPQGLSALSEPLEPLTFENTLPVQDLVNKAVEKRQGTPVKTIVSASHPKGKKSPILRVNFVTSQLFINSITLSMSSGRILKNITDNFVSGGVKVIEVDKDKLTKGKSGKG